MYLIIHPHFASLKIYSKKTEERRTKIIIIYTQQVQKKLGVKVILHIAVLSFMFQYRGRAYCHQPGTNQDTVVAPDEFLVVKSYKTTENLIKVKGSR